MRATTMAGRLLAAGACLAALLLPAHAASPAAERPDPLANAGCLRCHDNHRGRIEVAGKSGAPRALAALDAARFARGVHGDLRCVDCHQEITDSRANHARAAGVAAPDCVACHQALWQQALKDNLTEEKSRLGLVVRNIDAYRNSFHARPDKDDPSRAKANCEDCHGSHEFNVPPLGSARRTAWHRAIPATCGEKCHEDQLEAYTSSIHGEEVLDKGNVKAAVCTDCHTAHSVSNTSSDAFKLANVNSCGSCHQPEFKSYTDTYHGQVNRLGFTYTARCMDCHGSHAIRAVDDPKSKVNPHNRLKTCQACHSDKKPGMHTATLGFISFGPHANTHDLAKYPQMFIASKFMVGLLYFVFAFFWIHSGLWYYREWKCRREGRTEPHVKLEGLGIDTGKHFRRFRLGWRIAHLVFALVTMTLVLTGTTALYAKSGWAPVVARLFGGPDVVGLVHRVAATVFVGIFLAHFVYVMQKLLRNRRFRWFGPDSLIPNWKDFTDCYGMFRWFFGRGPRPQFDRWSYYEKFDYWAVFWGVNIIGWSGLMLAFPHITARYLPGWVFNVGTLVHGEEAFLAAVFLFTVHFFNNHFRPDKLPPPDVVMFTGTQSLEEFRQDHPAQYQRMVESGEITKHLVDAPSRAMHRGAVILGLALIAVGILLLVLVAVGFVSGA